MILERCSRYLSGGGERPLTGGSRRRLQDRISWLSGQGLRVLGAARSDGDGRKEEDMVFLGLAAMQILRVRRPPMRWPCLREPMCGTVMITGTTGTQPWPLARRLGISRGWDPVHQRGGAGPDGRRGP